MTRKVKLAFLKKDASRKAACNKRKNGLIKKANELSTLCGIDTCVIIYSPQESETHVWPSTADAQHVLARFISMPEMERSTKMIDRLEYISETTMKATTQLEKLTEDIRKKETRQVMYQCLSTGRVPNLSLMDLNLLSRTIEETVEEKYKEIKSLPRGTDSLVPMS